MLRSSLGLNGAVSAPHRHAALAGRDILEMGGTAIEAMVAMAATIAVVYPHMNGIGGDGFWLIHRPGQEPVCVLACGRAARLATPGFYRERGFETTLPARGAAAALTVPGTLSGWKAALDLLGADQKIPLPKLMQAAISYAKNGMAVTENQSHCMNDKRGGLENVPGFADIFMPDGMVPMAGSRLVQSALGSTLEEIACNGIESFYRGDLARTHTSFLEASGSPLRLADFEAHQPEISVPLATQTTHGLIYNTPPPTQGVASLIILSLFDRLRITDAESIDHLHGLIEATKQAFILRNAGLGDPSSMSEPAAAWLAPGRLDDLTARIDRRKALPWPHEARPGDTVWMGAADRHGNVVSFIQSVYWEFGSGLTCTDTGVYFQNRGCAFSLQPGPNLLEPGKRSFHTLNPALAKLSDGRIMAYGTMGGEGQPQTQAALFTRYAQFDMDLQAAITAPRWLLGRTWGEDTSTLKMESRFDPTLVSRLQGMGHSIELIEPFSDLAGHSGAVVSHSSGLFESGTDPRADGAALCL
ncbi:gamma-glutamyltransferase family protein [Rhizobium rhizogenes]|uniref:gamma-glutamyltransferase family protein n=1 Tax=Rhizobium rhizogenes TaxID=359 RepID=UPI0015748C8C|nr:gamma-glutamyltransferase family protein [Rhizobium rhizogenes]NTF46123.1 gamma-glutamyltransferase family protein [Rhizobium rhizogenes]